MKEEKDRFLLWQANGYVRSLEETPNVLHTFGDFLTYNKLSHKAWQRLLRIAGEACCLLLKQAGLRSMEEPF